MISRKLYKREDGTYYLFSQDEHNEQMQAANAIVARLNIFALALSNYDDTQERAKDRLYFMGVLTQGESFIKQERRRELLETMKSIPFGKDTREQLMSSTLDEIPSEIYAKRDDCYFELERYNATLKHKIQYDELKAELKEDNRCLFFALPDTFEEEMKQALCVEVPAEKIADCELFLQALEMLRKLKDKGAYLEGYFMPNSFGDPIHYPGIVENFLRCNATGYALTLDLGNVASYLNFK